MVPSAADCSTTCQSFSAATRSAYVAIVVLRLFIGSGEELGLGGGELGVADDALLLQRRVLGQLVRRTDAAAAGRLTHVRVELRSLLLGEVDRTLRHGVA